MRILELKNVIVEAQNAEGYKRHKKTFGCFHCCAGFTIILQIALFKHTQILIHLLYFSKAVHKNNV